MIAEGSLVLYKRRGCDSYELGVVKCRNHTDDGWFVWYSMGETAADTPDDCLFEFENAAHGALRGHYAKQLLGELG